MFYDVGHQYKRFKCLDYELNFHSSFLFNNISFNNIIIKLLLLGWMRNDQSCDALDEEHIKVDPDQDIDQFSSDCLENQDNEERCAL